MSKIKLTGKQIIELRAVATSEQQLKAWADCACEWIEGADEHIYMAFHPELGWAIDPKTHEKLFEEFEKLQTKLAKYEKV